MKLERLPGKRIHCYLPKRSKDKKSDEEKNIQDEEYI